MAETNPRSARLSTFAPGAKSNQGSESQLASEAYPRSRYVAFRGGCGGCSVSSEVARSLPSGEEKGWALVGGVGEYELVFAVPAGTPVADTVKIGRGGFTAQDECDFRIIYGGKVGRMVSPGASV